MREKRCEHYYACDICGNEVEDEDDLELIVLGAGRSRLGYDWKSAFKTVQSKDICQECIKEGKVPEAIERLSDRLIEDYEQSYKSYYEKFKEMFYPREWMYFE